jgi:hypothetical protein
LDTAGIHFENGESNWRRDLAESSPPATWETEATGREIEYRQSRRWLF